jgi:hypothetical protein
MNHLERVSCILGTLLVGLAGWVIVSERKAARNRALHPPVEKLAHDLQQAWAGYHTP